VRFVTFEEIAKDFLKRSPRKKLGGAKGRKKR
jgi:hypothetical protein